MLQQEMVELKFEAVVYCHSVLQNDQLGGFVAQL